VEADGFRGISRETTSAYSRLDVRWLNREGFLTSPQRNYTVTWSTRGVPTSSINIERDPNGIVLSYNYGNQRQGEVRRLEYLVNIEWTQCNYGGSRPWFRCPAKGCGRRVAVLYGGVIFACRQCHSLSYDSQKESAYNRALNRAQAIREKLGGSRNVAENFPLKPKGMHWRTYERLRSDAEEATLHSWPPWLSCMSMR
jgi:hypothetical protein